MRLREDGKRVVAIAWGLTAVLTVVVGLRYYTRAVLTRSVGNDDHVFNLAFVFFVFFAIFISVSASYGYGQDLEDVDPGQIGHAMLYQVVAQTFHTFAMALANWSLGVFLTRLVVKKWHKLLIWAILFSVFGGAIALVLVTWLGCSPPAYRWDDSMDGNCSFSIVPASYASTALAVAIDFFFAFFPWVFIWNLKMKRRDRLIILGSMSLGVFAGACGIKQMTTIDTLANPNYSRATARLTIWNGAEVAVTMVCNGIAMCLPLILRLYSKYRRFRRRRLRLDDSPGQNIPPDCDVDSEEDEIGLPHHQSGFSGSTLPASWITKFKSRSSNNGKASFNNKFNAAMSAPAMCERNPDVDFITTFPNPHTARITTNVVGGRLETGRGSREDFLASVDREDPRREERGITDDEALAGVVVTNEIKVSRTESSGSVRTPERSADREIRRKNVNMSMP